jgi:hypothetical protein
MHTEFHNTFRQHDDSISLFLFFFFQNMGSRLKRKTMNLTTHHLSWIFQESGFTITLGLCLPSGSARGMARGSTYGSIRLS